MEILICFASLYTSLTNGVLIESGRISEIGSNNFYESHCNAKQYLNVPNF
jgi:hypothetical protein